MLFRSLTDEQEDQIELQNVSNAAVNTTGWYVCINDSLILSRFQDETNRDSQWACHDHRELNYTS